jgi:hypothetical protein
MLPLKSLLKFFSWRKVPKSWRAESKELLIGKANLCGRHPKSSKVVSMCLSEFWHLHQELIAGTLCYSCGTSKEPPNNSHKLDWLIDWLGKLIDGLIDGLISRLIGWYENPDPGILMGFIQYFLCGLIYFLWQIWKEARGQQTNPRWRSHDADDDDIGVI